MDDQSSPVHGLVYPSGLLASLPILSQLSPSSPIRALSASQFSDIHLQYLLTHPQDHVLFPFLHGLEGANQAQNMFFQTNAATSGDLRNTAFKGTSGKPNVPRYRGLMWVVCDEDLDDNTQGILGSIPITDELDEDEDDDDECFSDESDDTDGYTRDACAMDIDAVESKEVVRIQGHDSFEDEAGHPGDDEKHMHPVNYRAATQQQQHDRRDSSASASSTLSSSYTSDSAYSVDSSATSISVPHSEENSDTVKPNTASGVPTSTSPATTFASPLPSPSPPISNNADHRPTTPPIFTSTFRPSVLLHQNIMGEWEFLPPKVPDGISLRNFGIQVPIYATLSDIVVYSPKGVTGACVELAERFRAAIEKKRRERTPDDDSLVHYNVFVLDADASTMRKELGHILIRLHTPGEGAGLDQTGAFTDRTDGDVRDLHAEDATHLRPNTVDFAQREKEEMRDLTKASEIISVFPSWYDNSVSTTAELTTTKTFWDPAVGQVFLGNSNDVPLAPNNGLDHSSPPPASLASLYTPGEETDPVSPFNSATNSPANGFGYDICVECHDLAPFPSIAHLRAAEEHLARLDNQWAARCLREQDPATDKSQPLPPRPPPNASAVIHLPFPSSPPPNSTTMSALIPVVKFLEKCLQPAIAMPSPPTTPPPLPPAHTHGGASSRRWSSVSSLMPSFPPFPLPSAHTTTPSPTGSLRSRSSTAPAPPTPPAPTRTRPLKILLYSSDGYTESSVPALCLLMAVRGLGLPEAYLELQIVKKRSFFVYQSDLGVLRRVEGRLSGDRGAGRGAAGPSGAASTIAWAPDVIAHPSAGEPRRPPMAQHGTTITGRPSAKSVSFAQAPRPGAAASAPTGASPMVVPSQGPPVAHGVGNGVIRSRPRANTSPWLPSLFGDHQSWFNDPRFDGSFPSRVLPFLYLGNLNHASNAYMLHALGITHVVSVGECALVPPAHLTGPGVAAYACHQPGPGAHFVAGKGPGGQGSLWIEEREGRIKVLDIKGVCDDGIDTLEPQLEPICEWIDRARAEGGQVLVHCRVGVSRSATVTIAYVMKHLGLPLVDAYLIVRSRRLSVLIQPNMRLLYNLCGWEIKLARERAGEDAGRLREELARTLSWPYLAKEVHALNEKYLH